MKKRKQDGQVGKDKDLIKDTYKQKRKSAERTLDFAHGRVSERTFEYMRECSTFIELIATQDKKHKKTVRSNSCKNRFCPICSWKKSQKDGMKIAVVMQAIKEELNYEFLFLTLTVPNVPAEELDNEIREMSKAYNHLTKLKAFKQIAKGHIRKLEVTYNKDRDDYHPHFHVLIAVNRSYFNSRYYIKQSEWLKMWRETTGKTGIDENGKDEIIALDVRRVKTGVNETAYLEMAKYSAKDSDLNTSQEVFDTFYESLKGKRLITYSGVFKDYAKKYDDKKLESYKELDTNVYTLFIRATWNAQFLNYEEEYQELTEEIKESYGINKTIKIDEIEVL